MRHAYDNVPFYRDKFDSAGLKPGDISTVEDMTKIPITTILMRPYIKTIFYKNQLYGDASSWRRDGL